MWYGKVLFTDESRYSLDSGRSRIWRNAGERFNQCCFTPKFQFGGGGILAWAGISCQAHTELITIRKGDLNAERLFNNV